MKNIYNKELNDFTRLTRHYQDWEVELAKPNKDYITTDYFCPRRDVSYDDCLNKLGKLEDIEEELGIDLITLIKAISNGVWVKTKNNISKHLTVALKKRHHTKEYWLFYRPYSHIYLKDYGKTWSLTKEELL